MINNSDKQVGLYSGGLIFFFGGGIIFGMRLALVHVVGLYTGGLIFGGGLYSEVYGSLIRIFSSISKFCTVHIYFVCTVHNSVYSIYVFKERGINRRNSKL